MHIAIRLLFPAILATAALAQDTAPPQTFRVRTLTIVSSTLPEPLRRQIIHDLQGIETDARAEELAERVRQHLRDAGYYNSRAEDAQITAIRETP